MRDLKKPTQIFNIIFARFCIFTSVRRCYCHRDRTLCQTSCPSPIYLRFKVAEDPISDGTSLQRVALIRWMVTEHLFRSSRKKKTEPSAHRIISEGMTEGLEEGKIKENEGRINQQMLETIDIESR